MYGRYLKQYGRQWQQSSMTVWIGFKHLVSAAFPHSSLAKVLKLCQVAVSVVIEQQFNALTHILYCLGHCTTSSFSASLYVLTSFSGLAAENCPPLTFMMLLPFCRVGMACVSVWHFSIITGILHFDPIRPVKNLSALSLPFHRHNLRCHVTFFQQWFSLCHEVAAGETSGKNSCRMQQCLPSRSWKPEAPSQLLCASQWPPSVLCFSCRRSAFESIQLR